MATDLALSGVGFVQEGDVITITFQRAKAVVYYLKKSVFDDMDVVFESDEWKRIAWQNLRRCFQRVVHENTGGPRGHPT